MKKLLLKKSDLRQFCNAAVFSEKGNFFVIIIDGSARKVFGYRKRDNVRFYIKEKKIKIRIFHFQRIFFRF